MKLIIAFGVLVVLAAGVYSQPIDVDEYSGTDLTDNSGKILKTVYASYPCNFFQKNKLLSEFKSFWFVRN